MKNNPRARKPRSVRRAITSFNKIPKKVLDSGNVVIVLSAHDYTMFRNYFQFRIRFTARLPKLELAGHHRNPDKLFPNASASL